MGARAARVLPGRGPACATARARSGIGPSLAGEPAVLDGLRPLRAPKEHFIPEVEPLLTFRGIGEGASPSEPRAAPARRPR